MATEDCTVVGTGKCPCGKGEIVVERCSPDHAYVRLHQVRYDARLDCPECAEEYTFLSDRPDRPPRLVRKADAEGQRHAQESWHAKLREIEASPDFRELKAGVEAWLSHASSVAARHRMLKETGIDISINLARLRERGFMLEARHVLPALKVVPVHLPALEALAREAESLWERGKVLPPPIRTGIIGLEA